MRSVQVYPLPPDVRVQRGLLVLPGGALVADTTSTRRELAYRHRAGFGYEGFNGAAIFVWNDEPAITERYGYPSDDYSEESMP